MNIRGWFSSRKISDVGTMILNRITADDYEPNYEEDRDIGRYIGTCSYWEARLLDKMMQTVVSRRKKVLAARAIVSRFAGAPMTEEMYQDTYTGGITGRSKGSGFSSKHVPGSSQPPIVLTKAEMQMMQQNNLMQVGQQNNSMQSALQQYQQQSNSMYGNSHGYTTTEDL